MTYEIFLDQSLLLPNSIDPRWAKGPFRHLQKMAPKTKGTRCEKILKSVLAQRGMRLESPLSKDHDIIADGHKYEIKSSCVNAATSKKEDRYSFLQIRPLQNYDYMLFCTYWFDGTVNVYKLAKKDIIEMVKSGMFPSQHEGKKSKGATYSWNGPITPFEKYFWFQFKVSNKL